MEISIKLMDGNTLNLTNVDRFWYENEDKSYRIEYLVYCTKKMLIFPKRIVMFIKVTYDD